MFPSFPVTQFHTFDQQCTFTVLESIFTIFCHMTILGFLCRFCKKVILFLYGPSDRQITLKNCFNLSFQKRPAHTSSLLGKKECSLVVLGQLDCYKTQISSDYKIG